ncbi:MAG: hypothetical protein A2091_04500 [Desulfuromonadales bacterium GWD2_61_12]|nr:MAG: hypothetical protein A2005_07565 [Desulfuromonadales bacterium GWC2_61_20]OGR34466.1 MAG: hypothetical protein A2091_04500 [Desulfuromonadales bacterium GWD2_61_12]
MSNSDQHHADGIVENRERRPPVYFTVLFYGLIVWGVIFIAYYLLSGWSSESEFKEKMTAHQGQTAVLPDKTSVPAPVPTATTSAPSSTPAMAVKDAKELFAENCAGCHGEDAKGGYGSDLTKDKFVFGKNAAAVRESIAAGRNQKMPAFAGKLSDAEIDTLVKLILEL